MTSMRGSKLIGILLIAALLSAASSDEVDGHLKTLRDRRMTAHEKVAALEALVTTEGVGLRRLGPVLAKEMDRLERELTKERSRLVRGVSAAAHRLMRARQTPRFLAEVATLQEKVLGVTRGSGLTKEKIRQVSDPAVARLDELLTVSPDQVFDRDEQLEETSFRVWELIDEAGILWSYWERTRAALEQDDEGKRTLARIETPWNPTGAEEALIAELRFQTEMATPMSKSDRKVLLKNIELATEISASEAEGNLILNRLRLRLGLPAVLTDVKLCEAARGHSTDMKEHDFFSHTSPLAGKESFGQRAALAGTSAHSENIAFGQGSPQAAIDAWWYSPGHHKNMLGSHGRVGLGRFESHWTQMFG